MTDQAFPRGKRKSSTSAAPSTEEAKKRPIENDFLFGSVEQPVKKKSTKDSVKHVKGDESGIGYSKTISTLPLGGGSVIPPFSSNGKVIPPKIELLTFSKMGKGMKVLGVIREVKEEYAVVALPTLLTGFVRRGEVSSDSFVFACLLAQFVAWCVLVSGCCCVGCKPHACTNNCREMIETLIALIWYSL